MPENYKSFVYQSVENFKIQYIDARVVVHFRPSAEWKGVGYGFDWMRENDYNLVVKDNGSMWNAGDAGGDKQKYVDTISRQYTKKFVPTLGDDVINHPDRAVDLETLSGEAKEKEKEIRDKIQAEKTKVEQEAKNPSHIDVDGVGYILESDTNAYQGKFVNDPDAFYILEKMHNYHQIPLKKLEIRKRDDVGFESYYCPWMSIYPEKKAILSLVVEQLTDDKPNDYEFEYNTEIFKVEFLSHTKQELKKSKKNEKIGIKDAISIECLKEFDKDETISIYAITGTKRKLAGKLYVWSNEAEKRKKANVISVAVNTKTSEVDIGTSDEEILSATEKEIRKLKHLNAEYLRQAYIELKDEEIITLDLSDDSNFKPKDSEGKGGHYYYEKGIVCFYESAVTTRKDAEGNYEKDEYGNYLFNYNYAPEGFIPLALYLNRKLKEHLEEIGEGQDKYNGYLVVFYLDQSIFNTTGSSYGGLGGYSDSSRNTVVLQPNPGANTVAHEILHAFNIMHTFSNKEFIPTSKFCFKASTTDNIMDYSHMVSPKISMFSLWQWQWVIANQSILSDGSIKPIKQLQTDNIIMPL